MTRQTLRLSDGLTVGAVVAGAGAPVLLIHGVGLRAEAWGPQVAALSGRHLVIAVDLPGHGESDALPGVPDLQDYVAWAARVVEGIGPVSLVGHSMGALIAAGLVVERPDLVRRVALLNGVFRRDAAARATVLVRASAIAAGQGDVTGPLNRWFGASNDDARALVAGWLGTVQQAGYAAAYRAFATGDAVYADRFGKIGCPLLALTADGDANSTPDMAMAMARAAPLGAAVVLAGHRHMMNLTAPDAVNAELNAWLMMEEVRA
jgi:(E)-2-((N-methylformamido)methylene)succinate hydrolase